MAITQQQIDLAKTNQDLATHDENPSVRLPKLVGRNLLGGQI